MNSRQVYIAYRKARRKFSLKTYILLAVWLVLALVQWLIVCLVSPIRDIFRKHYYVSVATFILAIGLFSLFLFFEKLRYNKILAPLISFVIVELQIISLFTFVSRTFWAEMLMYFGICAVLILLFVVSGVFLPRRMDLTIHIALIFILSFLFLLVAIYFLMLQLLVSEVWRDMKDYGFVLVQIPITYTMLFFVMYHAQTINGGRFAEMRLHDYCLGSLILFHDFLLIYWLTFYWQLISGVVTPKDWSLISTLWDRNDKRQLGLDDDEYTEYPERARYNNQATADGPRMLITQDFNGDRETESLHDRNRIIKWSAQKNRYKYARNLNQGITIEEPTRSIFNDEDSQIDLK